MSRLKCALGLALAISMVPTLSERLGAQDSDRSSTEELHRELMGLVEERLDQQRKQMMEEMDRVIRDALQARRGERNANRQIRNLEEQIMVLKDEIRRLRIQLRGKHVELTPVKEREVSTEEREANEEGEGSRPFFGIASGDIDEETARRFRVESGLLVGGVIAGSPADRASLLEGDVIVQLDGRPASSERLNEVIAAKRIGDPVVIEFVRMSGNDRLQMQSRAELGDINDYREAIAAYMAEAEREEQEAPDADDHASHDHGDAHGHTHHGDGDSDHSRAQEDDTTGVTLGVTVGQQDFELRVSSVAAGSNAAEAGLESGDVILRLDGRLVRSLDGLSDVLALLRPGQETVLQYRRGKTTYNARMRLSSGRQGASLLSLDVERREGSGDRVAPRGGGFLGIEVEQGEDGVRVSGLILESPAAVMGLRMDDVIVAVNDSKTPSKSTLGQVLSRLRPGQEVSVTINRRGREYTLKGRLGRRPEELQRSQGSGQIEPPVDPAAEAPARVSAAASRESTGDRAGLGIVGVMTEDNRVEVDMVLPDSGAGAAGIRKGDAITAVNGREIASFADLEHALADARVGDSLDITYARAGMNEQVPVKLAAMRAEVLDEVETAQPASSPYLGVELEQLARGFLVTRVNPDGPAERAGLRVGDRLAVNRSSELPSDFSGLREWLSGRAPGDEVHLQVQRGAETVTLPLIIGAQ